MLKDEENLIKIKINQKKLKKKNLTEFDEHLLSDENPQDLIKKNSTRGYSK